MSKVQFVKIKSSSDHSKEYIIRIFLDGSMKCSCPGFIFSGKCKHISEMAGKIKENLDNK